MAREIEAFAKSPEDIIKQLDSTKKGLTHKEAQKRLLALLRNNRDQLSDADQQILYELLMEIGTKYTITKEEQELLTLSGRKIVQLRKQEILEALGY